MSAGCTSASIWDRLAAISKNANAVTVVVAKLLMCMSRISEEVGGKGGRAPRGDIIVDLVHV